MLLLLRVIRCRSRRIVLISLLVRLTSWRLSRFLLMLVMVRSALRISLIRLVRGILIFLLRLLVSRVILLTSLLLSRRSRRVARALVMVLLLIPLMSRKLLIVRVLPTRSRMRLLKLRITLLVRRISLLLSRVVTLVSSLVFTRSLLRFGRSRRIMKISRKMLSSLMRRLRKRSPLVLTRLSSRILRFLFSLLMFRIL